MRSLRVAAVGIGLALAASGCGGGDGATADPTTSQRPVARSSTTPATAPTFARVPGGDRADVLSGEQAVVKVTGGGRVADVAGHRVTAPAGYVFNRTALDRTTALLVAEPAADDGRPQRPMLVDTRTGRTRGFTGPAVIKPAPQGTWAMAEGMVAYTTQRPGQVYCMVSAPVVSLRGRVLRCGKSREGLTQLRINGGTIGAATFVNATPMSCLSLWTSRAGRVTPVTEAKKCRGWEAVPVGGVVAWTEIVRPNEVEVGRVRAGSGGKVVELGQGSTGTLTGCGGWVWWSQPPAAGHGDRLMRWRPGGSAEVAFDPKSSTAPISHLTCSDDRLSFVRLDAAGGTVYAQKG